MAAGAGKNSNAWLVDFKSKAASRERPRDKPFGRRLDDFLDQDSPSGLLPMEERLLQACAIGQVCDGGTAVQIPGSVRIRAGFLRFLILGGDENAPVHEAGVELRNASIDGPIDLRGAQCVGRISLVNCSVAGKLQIEDAKLGILNLPGTDIHGIDGNRAHIAGSVLLEASHKPDGTLDRGFNSAGTISLFGADIGGTLQCSGAKIKPKKGDNALVCTAARINGNVYLNSGFESSGPVWLNGVDLRGKLNCNKGTFSNSEACALNLDGARLSSDATFSGATFVGSCSFVNTRVGADLSFSNATATRTNGTAVDGRFANIGNDLLLDEGFKSNGGVMLGAIKIGGSLVCINGKFANLPGRALDLDGANIAGSAWLNDAAIDGQVSMVGAHIGTDLCCAGAAITPADGFALDCSFSSIGGGARLNQEFGKDGPSARFHATGGVSFYGASIGLDFNAFGGRFINGKGDALILATAKIKGYLYLGQAWTGANLTGGRFEAEGTVNLYGATVGGNIECIGGRFEAPALPANDGPCAIRGDALTVGGCVFLSGPTRKQLHDNPSLAAFTSNGEVRLVGAQIGMQVNCCGGEFTNNAPNVECQGAAGYALNLAIATIKYEFLLGTTEQTDAAAAVIKGSLNLRGAKTRELADRAFVRETGIAAGSFPKTVSGPDGETLQCHLFLDGFIYERLNGNSSLTYGSRKSWLKRQPKQEPSGDFRHQPFDHLVKVLRAMGREDEARNVAIFKQRQLTRSSKLGSRLVRNVFDAFMSYGHRPAQGLIIAFVVAVAAGWFFEAAARNGALTPKETGAHFHPYVYSLDVMLPVVKLGEAEAWQPSGREFRLPVPLGLGNPTVCGECTRYAVWLETVFGWLAGGLLAAVVAGLIKKD